MHDGRARETTRSTAHRTHNDNAALIDVKENDRVLKQMEELREVVERIDFKWEKGFMTPEEYVAKRSQLQKDMEALRPVDYDELYGSS